MADIYNSDIYNMRQVIDNTKNQFIEEEDASVLEASTYGFVSAQLAKLSASVIKIAAENSSEVFYHKARIPSNIISHAISLNISDLNATPAVMNILFCITEDDLNLLFEEQNSDTVVLDNNQKIYIGDYEYHFDYPILISKKILLNNKSSYSARYDMSDKVCYSNIDNPYLSTPYVAKMYGYNYIFIATTIHQVMFDTKYEKVISDNNIDNKTYTFDFKDQLVYFDVFVKDDTTTTRVTPVLKNDNIDGITNYCWYEYVNTNMIRIIFDLSSYFPSINSEITINIRTTKGTTCNFTSKSSNILCVLEDTDNYSYLSIQTMIMPQSKSKDAKDKKSIEEIKKLLPKESNSRGNLTSVSDLNNFFDKINSSNTRLLFDKKVDNVFREYYGYYVAKNSKNNIIPTNTIDIKIKISDLTEVTTVDGSILYLFPTKYAIGYKNNGGSLVGDLIPNPTTELMRGYDYIYSIPYKVLINKIGPKVSYLMTIMDEMYMVYFKYINELTPIQFIVGSVDWKRDISSNKYTLTIDSLQNLNADCGVMETVTNPETEEESKVCNMKVILVTYINGDTPYRYFISDFVSYSDENDNFTFKHQIELVTNDMVDENNNIKIENGYAYGEDTIQYGYLEPNTKSNLYILCKFKDENGSTVEYGRYDLDTVIKDSSILEGYSVTNVYNITDGITFFDNFSDIISTIAAPTTITSNNDGFKLNGVPVVKKSYLDNSELLMEFIDSIKNEKKIIDNALYVLENQFSVDFKFVNTYGFARLYTTNGTTSIGKVNISLRYALQLQKASDDYTVGYIKQKLKEYIEQLDNANESVHLNVINNNTASAHINSINYFDFKGYNTFDANVSHIYANTSGAIDSVPELININQLDDGTPDITIDIE